MLEWMFRERRRLDNHLALFEGGGIAERTRMGFWDSFKAGFYGAAGVDYYAQQTRDEVRGLRADLARVRTNVDDVADLGIFAVQPILERVESALNAIQRGFGNPASLKAEAIARKDELRLLARQLLAIQHDPDVLAVPGLDSALLDTNFAIRSFAKACNYWATDQQVRGRIEWDLAMLRWNEAGDLLDEIASR